MLSVPYINFKIYREKIKNISPRKRLHANSKCIHRFARILLTFLRLRVQKEAYSQNVKLTYVSGGTKDKVRNIADIADIADIFPYTFLHSVTGHCLHSATLLKLVDVEGTPRDA